MAQGYGMATNATGSYYHEFVDFKNVTISSHTITSKVTLPTSTGWSKQSDRGVWTQNGYSVTVMGNANVTTKFGTALPMQAAATFSETQVAMQASATLADMSVTETATHDQKVSFANDHFDDNWYALLAELHVQEQRKKDKWHGQDDGDDWLAEFEKLALLELRK